MLTRREMLIGSSCSILAATLANDISFAAEPQRLDDLLESIRKRFGLPGMAACIVNRNQILASGVCGFRKMGEKSLNPPTAHWQLGSITKTFTATLTAILVQKGQLSWDRTLKDIYPEHVAIMSPKVAGITVRQLITHKSGFNGDVIPWEGTKETNAPKLTLTERRQKAVVLALKSKLLFNPGAKYEYSNQGYNLLGAALEKVAGHPWEELIRNEIVKKVGIASLVFGEPALERPNEEPWPHVLEGQQWKPVHAVEPKMHGYFICNPAGGISLTLAGAAKWMQAHMNKEKGSSLLSAESFKTIHSTEEEGGVPAFGIGTQSPILGKSLSHNGSNGRNYANLMILPERELGIFVAINAVPPDGSLANWMLWNSMLATAFPGTWPMPAMKPPAPAANGTIEGEALEVVRQTGGRVEFQNFDNASQKFQLWWAGAKDGNKLVLRFQIPRAGRYTIEATCAKNADYGDVNINIGSIDKQVSFQSKKLQWEKITLGDTPLAAGSHDMTITAHGNAGQRGIECHLGLDVLTIRKAD